MPTTAAIATRPITIQVHGKLDGDGEFWEGGVVDPFGGPVTVTFAVDFATAPTPSITVTWVEKFPAEV